MCARPAVAAVAVGGRAQGRAGQATESAVAGCGSERSRGFTTQDTPQGKGFACPGRRSGTMQRMLEMVEVPPHPPERFESVLEPEPFAKLADGIRAARDLLGQRTVWNVNSTAEGGGVAEMLRLAARLRARAPASMRAGS